MEDIMTLYEQRVKRLHDHVVKNEQKNVSGPTLKEVKSILDEKGIEYDAKAKKEELITLLEGAK